MIHVRNVSKLFRVIHNRENSLKSKFVRMIRSRLRERVEDFWALRDVSLRVRRGETLAVLGRNGSGKSTLLRVISGIYPATAGSVEVEGGAGMAATLELGVGFHPELTGEENLRLSAGLRGLSKDQIEELTPRVVAFSELGDFMDVPMKFYSSGMYMRLAFSLETCLWPDALLVDEVLSVGDDAFKAKCNKRLMEHKERGGAILLVSHSVEQVRAISDRACVLKKGRLVLEGTVEETIQAFSTMLRDDKREAARCS